MKTIKIKMLETRRGIRGPFQPFKHEAGTECNVPLSLAQSYIEKGIAELITDQSNTKQKRKKKSV